MKRAEREYITRKGPLGNVQRAIALELSSAWKRAFYSESPTSAWEVCMRAVADGLAKADPEFDRAAFIEACRFTPPKDEGENESEANS